ncbi:MAG: gamma carbonic anhydrase family protein [Crocinitomicaceae bacterium]|nr:gamma carbonic anhydrase family protein [Crocinitomicaceae bacterium]|tara:strand:+ start:1010 stop:1549 length:540 start_codon:yes stop_codon:yes gene_type:complete
MDKQPQHPIVLPVRDIAPVIHDSVWLAPNCTVVGEVTINSESTIWFGAIVRGDVASIEVGSGVNIQDGAVIHGTYGQSKTVLEDHVSIGHNAIVHGAKVCKGALIGMGAVVMDNAVVGEFAVVAAGAVVLERTIIPPRTLYAGVPAKNRGDVREDLQEHLSQTADRYIEYAGWFRGSDL